MRVTQIEFVYSPLQDLYYDHRILKREKELRDFKASDTPLGAYERAREPEPDMPFLFDDII